MLTKEEKVSLTNLKEGAAIELFNYELQRVLDNIVDPNTDPEFKREITLKVSFKPDENRDIGLIEISCLPKLAGQRSVMTKIMVGKVGGHGEAREFGSPQQTLFKDPEKVIPIDGKEAKEND